MDPEFERLVIAHGERVVLRRKHPGDVHADWRWRTDPEVSRYDGQEALRMSFREFAAQHEAEIVAPAANRRMFALLDGEGKHIGNVMYYNVSPGLDEAEVGISIGEPEARDRGLGTEAMVVFLRYLFATSSLRRIVLHTLEWNERAFRSFQKAGFEVVEWVTRTDGERFVRMAARREWWLMWDSEGRFERRQMQAGERSSG